MEPVKDIKIKHTQLFINNEWVNSKSGKTFQTINPSSGKPIADVQQSNKDDVDIAVGAAKKAFELGSEWRRMDPTERAKLMVKLADLIERDCAILSTLETMDNGKPFVTAVGDMMLSVKWLRYYASYTDKLCGKTVPVDGNYFCYTRLEPVGVVGAILPWNFPLPMAICKLGPALCAGCTIVIKPAEQTPLTTLYLASLVKEVGIPPGVVNVLPGFGDAGSALSHHLDVDKVSFTGSTEVGRLIMKASADSNLKKVTLELGGKSPNIVFADADLDFAVEMSHFALFFNMGQCCTAGSRTYVHEDIYDKFLEKAVQRAKSRKVGDPFDPNMESGPQIDNEQFEKILDLIESGKKEGARLMCGGAKANSEGFFIQPTVFADVKDSYRIAKEEIFGPVQQLIKFKTMDDVVARANNTTYGLAASVFTKDIDKALSVAHSLRAGTVWVNCYHVVNPNAPFGGYNQSGIGREHSDEGIKEYCEVKTVYVRLEEKLSIP